MSISTTGYRISELPVVAELPEEAMVPCSLPTGLTAAFTVKELIPRVAEATVESIVTAAKQALFIDIWNIKCRNTSWGRYDPAGAPDADHPYYLNKLWLTYEEALMVDAESRRLIDDYDGAMSYSRARTFYPIRSSSGWVGATRIPCAFIGCANLETLFICDVIYVQDGSQMFTNCAKLKSITRSTDAATIDLRFLTSVPTQSNMFSGCTALEDVRISGLKTNFSFMDCPNLSLATLSFLVDNRMNGTTAVTVTVHPTVYAKLTDTANTQWNAVLTRAAAGNISFAK